MAGMSDRYLTMTIFRSFHPAISLPIFLTLSMTVGPLQLAHADCSVTNLGITPLCDLVGETYKGYAGGLYPNMANNRPPAHLAAGLEIAANQIKLWTLREMSIRIMAKSSYSRSACPIPPPSGARASPRWLMPIRAKAPA